MAIGNLSDNQLSDAVVQLRRWCLLFTASIQTSIEQPSFAFFEPQYWTVRRLLCATTIASAPNMLRRRQLKTYRTDWHPSFNHFGQYSARATARTVQDRCPRLSMSSRPSTVVLVRWLPACLWLPTAPSPVIRFTVVCRSTCTQHVWWPVLCHCRAAGVELFAGWTATM